MITKLEVLNTIAVRYGYKDWIHIGFFKEAIELTPMIEEAMELYTELSNSHKHGVMPLVCRRRLLGNEAWARLHAGLMITGGSAKRLLNLVGLLHNV